MNQQTKRLNGKIVLLPKEYLVDYPDLEKQLKGATFKYQIVNLDEIKSAVKEKKEGYCYVSKYLAQANFGVTNQPCAGLFITETNTGDILFASSELCNTGYFSKPFKGIADDIKDAKY